MKTVQNISCHSKMLIILLNISYFSRYIMKVRHQKVELWVSQNPKKETRLKTRVNPCPAYTGGGGGKGISPFLKGV